jgi:hypothetical protein
MAVFQLSTLLLYVLVFLGLRKILEKIEELISKSDPENRLAESVRSERA